MKWAAYLSLCFFGLLSVEFFFAAPSALAAGATWTQQTDAGRQSWQAITSSADGTKLAAVECGADCGGTGGGYIYTSSDSGVHWTPRTGPGLLQWRSITSSSDGTKLAAIVNGGHIWTSVDSGVTWVDQTLSGSRQWQSITSSADGVKLAALVNGSGTDIYISTDSGVHWAIQTKTWSSADFLFITSSADFTKLATGDNLNGYIYTSADSGVTWTPQTGSEQRHWGGITSSSDGTKIIAGDETTAHGYIYTSPDSGVTWTPQTGSGQHEWQALASSADGSRLIAGDIAICDPESHVWTSVDSGVNWQQQANSGCWNSVAISSDGTKLVAADLGGYIYTATIAAAPAVTTQAASSVAATSVVGNGTVTSAGGDTITTRGFVYGANTAYGATTTDSGSYSTGTFSATISSLTCNTGYHFAAYATNSVGTAYGSDTTFTTDVCPTPAPSTSTHSSGGGAVVGSGPTAPSAEGLPGYVKPRPQIDYPDGTIVYLDVPGPVSTTLATSPSFTPTSLSLPQNRQLWDRGEDIRALQKFFNTHGYILATAGPGSPGNETSIFGNHFYSVLIKFQKDNNIPPTGYLGVLTRAALVGTSATH